MNYKLFNNITGWVCWLIATVTYVMTIEPTASFWDCGEFIATSYKLEVGHPPGAPTFMILARFFSLFAGGDVTQVAKMINLMSALASSFTILFLFWTITHLAKKIVAPSNEINIGKLFAILGSGIVGALAYTFSDTFWFSAVEGEVYASSSLFTAIVFWAILKWENVAHEKYANRWIILIAYLIGLSIGIHLLNLLAIPAIVFVYYFKKYEVSRNGIIYASLISVILLGLIMYGIIPGIVIVASWFELLFVNGFGLPYNTGVIIYGILLIGGIVWGIRYTIRKQKVLLNTIILALTVMLIGYSAYMITVIRSSADPPMDQNNPENLFTLLDYLNREQYGDRPLIYGAYYNAPTTGVEKVKPIRIKKDGKYVISHYKQDFEYDSRFKTLFPRMFSRENPHINVYKNWADIKGKSIRITNERGESEVRKKPTFFENIKFFFTYQLGHMYFRYFMWNFAGRQNDIQGHGKNIHGNWISGIPLIDEWRLGDQSNYPESLSSLKSMNKYYMLPLLLGILGLLFHHQHDPKRFWIILLLFFFTGIAIVIYLNQKPIQPRERDYAYAASFYAYTIWIGLGVLSVYYLFKKKLPLIASSLAATIICLLLVPCIMAMENWDDHDRSGRYTARDFAYNYLNSCAPNAILFTNGDNDTFPLWYAQEVEGIRTDVRVACIPYLSTDWYIDQMKSKAYESDPLPISLTHEQYQQGTRDIVYLLEDSRIKEPIELKRALEFVGSDDPRTQLRQADNANFIPSKDLRITVDSAKVIQNGIVKPEDARQMVKYIEWKLNKRYIIKNQLIILDILATSNWDRPVYFTSFAEPDELGFSEYLQLEGFAYRFVPFKTQKGRGHIGRIDTDLLYDNLMNKFKWGRMNEPDVYIEENNIRTSRVVNLRTTFPRLATELLREGKNDSAIAVLDKCVELMPHEKYPYSILMINIIRAYYALNEVEKGNAIASKLADITEENLDYFLSLEEKHAAMLKEETQQAVITFQNLIRTAKGYQQNELSEDFEKRFDYLKKKYNVVLQ